MILYVFVLHFDENPKRPKIFPSNWPPFWHKISWISHITTWKRVAERLKPRTHNPRVVSPRLESAIHALCPWARHFIPIASSRPRSSRYRCHNIQSPNDQRPRTKHIYYYVNELLTVLIAVYSVMNRIEHCVLCSRTADSQLLYTGFCWEGKTDSLLSKEWRPTTAT